MARRASSFCNMLTTALLTATLSLFLARADLYGGTGAFGLDEPQRALEDISAAIELDPKAEYYYQRAILRAYKQPERAFSDISKAIELKPTGWYYNKRAELRRKLKQPPQAAIDDLSAALAITPSHDYRYSDYLDARADLLKKIGKLDEAEKDYTALVEADPKDAYKRHNRMLVLLELGRDQDAEAERKLIDKLDPKALDRSFICKVAEIRARRGAEASAAGPEDLRKAWSRRPSPRTWSRRGKGRARPPGTSWPSPDCRPRRSEHDAAARPLQPDQLPLVA